MKIDVSHTAFPVLVDSWPRYQDIVRGIAVGDVTVSSGQQFPAAGGYDSGGDAPLDVAIQSDEAMSCVDADNRLVLVGVHDNGSWSPVVADIDADGLRDVISGGDDLLMVQKPDGQPVTGFPKWFSSPADAPAFTPAVGDINGDGYLEIVYVTDTQVHVIDHTGAELTGWPRNIPEAPSYTPVGPPCIGDLDDDGHLEIVIGSRYLAFSKIGVYNYDGSWHDGWPTAVINEFLNPPIIGDINEDSKVEIVATATHSGAGNAGSYMAWRPGGVQLFHQNYDYEFLYTPAVGDFVPPYWLNKELLAVAKDEYGYYKILVIDAAAPGTIHQAISLGNDYPTSSLTVADVNGAATNDVIIGVQDKLLAYDLYCGDLITNWDCPLNDDVTTPLVCDLDDDGDTDILTSDSDGVYAFTTDEPYIGIAYGGDCDWVREGHDNLNMGLWDIAAPTGVAAVDNPDDQGGVITLTWVPSVDDGVRSTRVTGYEIWGTSGEILPDSGSGDDNAMNPALARKLAEGKRAAFMQGEAFAAPTSLTGENGEMSAGPAAAAPVDGKDSGMFALLDTVPAGTYTYEVDGLENGLSYEYRIIATDGTRHAQKSVTVNVVPHDNIPPAPPTNLAGAYEEGPSFISNHLTWTLSTDDPFYEEGQPGDAVAGSPAGPGALSPFPNRAGAPYSGNRGGAAVSSGLDTAAYAGLPTDLAPSALGTVAGFGDESAGMSDRQKEFLKKKIASALPGAPKGYYAPPPQGFPNYGRDGGANDVEQYLIVKAVTGQPNAVNIFVTCGTTEFFDMDISLGNEYTYMVYALDSENESTAAGPIVIDLRSIPGDAGGPYAAAPTDPLGAAFPDDPRRASDPGNIAAGGFLEGGAHPASVITCRPNPIKGTATFQINVRKATRATLSVFDVSGRKVATVYDGPVPAGGISATWAADVPNGIYLYTLETEEKRYSGKTAVLR